MKPSKNREKRKKLTIKEFSFKINLFFVSLEITIVRGK
jgi:hypothetical protein